MSRAKLILDSIDEAYDPNKVFPDTKEGAFACIQQEVDKKYVSKWTMSNCKFVRDPAVKGVWKVTGPGAEFLVTLKGYPDPFGQTRDSNDAEWLG